MARLAIVSLPNVGPIRSRWILSGGDSDDATKVAVSAVERFRNGVIPDGGPAPLGVNPKLLHTWRTRLRQYDLGKMMDHHHELGIELLSPLDPRWPFADDPDPPMLLFCSGDIGLFEHPVSVAVVGTRRCTTVGRTVAYDLGHGFATADVCVVSGLALGVDGAAHRGALDAGGPVIGVVASGLDVVYPGGNRQLWHRVEESGLLLSEAPAGERPKRWQFPARNRLIAALSEGVVVVESHRSGGSLLTVDEAVDRGKPVFAVPGSVLSSASDGTNDLLVEGATPVRKAPDVLYGLGLTGYVPEVDPTDADWVAENASKQPVGGSESEQRRSASQDQPPEDPLVALIMGEVRAGPVHVDRLVLASTSSAAEVLAAVQTLVASGRIKLDGSTVSLQ